METGSGSTSVKLSQHEEKSYRRRAFERARHAATSQDILLFLVAFRILNALSIRTFFQPDEYFQSLEPAWEMAFGADSGAWITWVSCLLGPGQSIFADERVGVETSTALSHTSSYVCCCLSSLVLCLSKVTAISFLPRGINDSCAEDTAGGVCGTGGLLHLETGGENVRARE